MCLHRAICHSLIQKDIVSYRLCSAIYGVAIGDALGVPAEFESRVTLVQNPVTDMIDGYRPKGTYSDDTAMTLRTLASLQENHWVLNLHDIMGKFSRWMDEGYMAVDGIVFDVGNTTRQAISRFNNNAPLEEWGSTSFYECGNGSLMRIMPIVFYLQKHPEVDKYEAVKQVSGLTHAHEICTIGCHIYVMFCLAVLNHEKLSKEELLSGELPKIYKDLTSRVSKESLCLYERVFDFKKFIKLPNEAIKSDGYVLYALEAALWCFMTTDDYSSCVLKAVNLGCDSDTTAAIAGGLAGLYYGYEGIPKGWVSALRSKEVIEQLCV